MSKLQKSLFIGLSLIVMSSHAALFDDKEARKKILSVEAANQTINDAQTAEIEDLKRRVTIQSQGLLGLQGEIELLKQEIAQLRGVLEVADYRLETSEQRQKDLYADTDARLRQLEDGESSSELGLGKEGEQLTEAEDQKSYKEAYGFSQNAKHKEAFDAYDTFIKTHPDSRLMADALYGLGYSQFALKSYNSSIVSQQKLLKSFPDSPKAPNAVYSIANSQIQLGQVKNAKASLSNLIDKYPNAEIIPKAKKRLKVLETIK